MMGTMSMRQPENWLYEIWQKGYDSPCYVMVPNAKDLVKSHLMIAVREEVEVLKEKISELLDKINQLEVENTLLKANMPQEKLQQLQTQTQLQIAGSATTATTNGSTQAAITAPPAATGTTVAATAPTAAATSNADNQEQEQQQQQTVDTTQQTSVDSSTAAAAEQTVAVGDFASSQNEQAQAGGTATNTNGPMV